MEMNIVIYIGNFWSESDVEKISIALSQPRGMNLKEERALNPTWDILNKYKRNSDWKSYVIKYNEILSKLDPFAIEKTWNGKMLCCWCKYMECHRYLVAEWLKNAKIEVTII